MAPSTTIRSQRRPAADPPAIVRDPDILAAYLEDASGAPPGEAAGLVRVGDEDEAAALLASLPAHEKVLCQAARTSLTGGAIPRRELVVSVERMDSVGRVEVDGAAARVTAGPGVRLDALQRELAGRGYFYPPVPTYDRAMLGGTAATNAGGAATFKYGVTRQWVRGLRVVLFNGEVLELERGRTLARPGEPFRIRLAAGDELLVPVPEYRLPDLRKISAGYHASDPLDLIDLFVGSEGTLGLITSVTVDLVPLPPALITGLVFLQTGTAAHRLARDLRSAALDARRAGDPRGPDVRAIEFIDDQGLNLLRRSGAAATLRVTVPADAAAALLFDLELPEPLADAEAHEVLGRLIDGDVTGDQPLARLYGLLRRHASLDAVELAFPEDAARREALRELREAVPQLVNELLAERRRAAPGLRKVGGDLIVPFERVEELARIFEHGFAARGLEFAVWGHLSDGNLHPNALPRDASEVDVAVAALREFADAAIRFGGCPLSEHGVGRDALKQELLRRFLGHSAIESMRRVKSALDPIGRFAPGVLFPASAA